MTECKEYFYPNGNLKMIICKNDNNQYHNDNGPAYQYFNKDGTLKSERYMVKNQYHRTDGPAINHRYDNNHGAFARRWFINDKDYTLQVEKWLKDNNIQINEINKDLCNRMWLELL